jgi:hypothetical protein
MTKYCVNWYAINYLHLWSRKGTHGRQTHLLARAKGCYTATLAVCKKAKWKREMNDVGMYHIQKPITFRIVNLFNLFFIPWNVELIWLEVDGNHEQCPTNRGFAGSGRDAGASPGGLSHSIGCMTTALSEELLGGRCFWFGAAKSAWTLKFPA